jgi:hypothetical protein
LTSGHLERLEKIKLLPRISQSSQFVITFSNLFPPVFLSVLSPNKPLLETRLLNKSFHILILFL